MYYLIYGLLYLISLLPLRVLYVLSSGIYGCIYYVVKYRRATVHNNLLQAFPNKTEGERKGIEKQFYKNFVDSFVETIKMISTGKKFIDTHYKGDISLIKKYDDLQIPVQVHACHQFNWEWANVFFSLTIPQPHLLVYMPLSTKAIDRLFYKLRNRANTVLLPATDMKTKFAGWRKKSHMITLVADQNPGHPKNAYWFNFFGKPTPFIIGPERLARAKAVPVLFAKSVKIKRGQYEVIFETATENAATLAPTELTKMYVAFVTKAIIQQPQNWLWSHRRWKYNWNEDYGKLID